MITLQEARRLSKLFPNRFKLEAKFLSGSGDKPALFMYRVFEKKDLSDYQVVFDSAPFGLGRYQNHKINSQNTGVYGEWLIWD